MRNWEKRKNFGNSVAEIQQKLGKRKTKGWREKEEEFRQHCYRNSSAQILARPVSCVLKKSNCGNAIAEIGKKRKNIFGNCGNSIAKNGKKKLNGIMAMSLPKMGGKKKFCCWNLGRNFQKKCYVYNIFIILSQQITGD